MQGGVILGPIFHWEHFLLEVNKNLMFNAPNTDSKIDKCWKLFQTWKKYSLSSGSFRRLCTRAMNVDSVVFSSGFLNCHKQNKLVKGCFKNFCFHPLLHLRLHLHLVGVFSSSSGSLEHSENPELSLCTAPKSTAKQE